VQTFTRLRRNLVNSGRPPESRFISRFYPLSPPHPALPHSCFLPVADYACIILHLGICGSLSCAELRAFIEMFICVSFNFTLHMNSFHMTMFLKYRVEEMSLLQTNI